MTEEHGPYDRPATPAATGLEQIGTILHRLVAHRWDRALLTPSANGDDLPEGNAPGPHHG